MQTARYLISLVFFTSSFDQMVRAKLPEGENLFAQDDFSQWTKVDGKPVGNGWIIKDGLVHRKSLSGDIITREKFKDFELSFEWKISVAGNSGIKYRTRDRLGLEYQILDDQKHRDNKNPTHRAGSLYELVAAPDSKNLKPVGAWNQGRIVAEGKQIQHWLNGEKVVEIIWGTDDWKKRFQKSKYRKNEGFGSWEGPILLQDHNDPVWYQELRVKRL